MKLAKVEPNLLDRAIGAVSPQRYAKRMRARAAASAINALGSMLPRHRGAASDRLLGDWSPTNASADDDNLHDLPKLRARSRDLYRNNAWAQAIEGMADAIVGTGLMPHAHIDHERLGISEDKARKFGEDADFVMRRAAQDFDAAGMLSLWRAQHMLCAMSLVDGEQFAKFVNYSGSQFLSTRVEIIDPDRVESPNKQVFEQLRAGTNTLRNGIEVNAFGRPVAYYVRKVHPSERGRISLGRSPEDWRRIPASGVMHVFDRRRTGQTRGLPRLAPVIPLLDKIDRLAEAELVTAYVTACHAVFMQSEDPDADLMGLGGDITTDVDGQREQRLSPGMIMRLRPGEQPVAFNPNRPGNTYQPFHMGLLREAAAGLGTTYEVFARDFSQGNFAAARMAEQLSGRFHRRFRGVVVETFCQPYRNRILREAILSGHLALPFRGELTPEREFLLMGATWSGPGGIIVEPLKDAEAAAARIKGGTSTQKDEAAAYGRDYREVNEQRAAEEREREKLGLPPLTGADIAGDDEEQGAAGASGARGAA